MDAGMAYFHSPAGLAKLDFAFFGEAHMAAASGICWNTFQQHCSMQ
jgi:hypothetical protein